MAWDLAISEHGDLIFGANRDLAGVSGINLIEQRMKIRLKLQRGSWVFDDTETLGGNLHILIGQAPDKAAQAAPALVREALRPMEEINVDDVLVDTTNNDVTLKIFYSLHPSGDEDIDDESGQRQLVFTLPFAVTGGV